MQTVLLFFGFGGQKDIQFNPATGRYEFEEEETGDVKPGMGGRFFGGLMSLLTGVPVVGSAIGTAYDYGKGIFGKKQKPSDFNFCLRSVIGGLYIMNIIFGYLFP